MGSNAVVGRCYTVLGLHPCYVISIHSVGCVVGCGCGDVTLMTPTFCTDVISKEGEVCPLEVGDQAPIRTQHFILSILEMIDTLLICKIWSVWVDLTKYFSSE